MFEQNKPRLAELDKTFLNSVPAGRFLPPQKGLPCVTRIFYIWSTLPNVSVNV
jgi:hypothetical protein